MREDFPRVTCVHGFLGAPGDWEFLTNSAVKFEAVDLFGDPAFSSARDLKDLAGQVNRRTRGSVLMGYSMGGRIAIQALLDDPDRWEGAILISTHAGLSSPEERQSRRDVDERWACRFESEPWDEVLRAWNRQPVFQSSAPHSPPLRPEGKAPRAAYAHALRAWSLGTTPLAIDRVAQVRLPILWVSGSRDLKYIELNRNYARQGLRASHQIVEGAGHRVPFEAPHAVTLLLNRFLNPNQQEALSTL